MPFKSIVKNILGIKCMAIDKVSVEGEKVFIDVHPTKGCECRCGCCGCKGRYYDKGRGARAWRTLDCGGHEVYLRYSVYRVYCPHCKAVHTCMVPWASHGSRFTERFEQVTAWVALQMDKSAASKFMRIAWHTVGDIMSRVFESVAAKSASPLEGLVNIGIDETSYRKGHSYITVVVNHDTNTVVWAHKGHGKEIIEMFFNELTEDQRASILLVSGDGARWITESVKDFCPNAKRCVDPFHVVEWANNALDSMRIDAWRRARATLAEMVRKIKEDGTANDKDAKERIRQAKKDVEQIKQSKYALGKNPENLTANQQERLALIQAEDPQLMRGHAMKEKLRLIFKLTDQSLAEEELDGWLGWAQRCRIPAFVELGRKIRRHKEHILNTVRNGLSNARIEATNNKIKLLLRIAYGFRNIDTMIGLVMLFCSSIEIPWPGRKQKEPINKGSVTTQAA